MSHPTTDAILVESDGPVRIVTLNRPDSRNAIVQDVKDALLRIWDDLADDLDVRAVVLTGAGSAFSAGGDIANFPNVAADGDYRRRVRLRNGRKIIDSLTNFPLPLVVAVNGPAVGLGCSIASSVTSSTPRPTPSSPTRTCPSGWWPVTGARRRGP